MRFAKDGELPIMNYCDEDMARTIITLAKEAVALARLGIDTVLPDVLWVSPGLGCTTCE